MGIVFLTSTMAGYIHARDKETPDGVVLTNNVKGDDRMKLLIIGKTGTGKSSLCNVITGHDMDSDIFPVSAKAVSCTQSTQFANVNFNANVGRPISLIDTIGFDDPKKDKDADIIGELVHQLKNNCDYVNLFMIAVNGQNPRLDGALMGMIRIFEGMFGQEFWKQTVIVFTRIPMDVNSVKKRKRINKQSDEDLAKKYLKVVENEFPNGNGLQYLFMDACYDTGEDDTDDTENDADPAEKKAFNNAMEILWKLLSKSPRLTTSKVKEVETENKKLKMAIAEKEKEQQLILAKWERKQQEWKDAQENLKKQWEEEQRMAAEEQAKKMEKLKIDMEGKHTEEKRQEIERKMKEMEIKHQQSVENMKNKQRDEQDALNRQIQMQKEELENEPGFWSNVGRGALAGATLGISEMA